MIFVGDTGLICLLFRKRATAKTVIRIAATIPIISRFCVTVLDFGDFGEVGLDVEVNDGGGLADGEGLCVGIWVTEAGKGMFGVGAGGRFDVNSPSSGYPWLS